MAVDDAALGQRQAQGLAVLDVREVDAAVHAEAVPSPDPDVDVQQLVAAVTGVALELHLHEPGQLEPRDQRCRERLQLRDLDGLDERAAQAEVHGILPAPSGGHRDQDLAVAAERRHRELARPAAGDQLLDHQAVGADQLGGQLVGGRQLLRRACGEGLPAADRLEGRRVRRLDDRREDDVQGLQLLQAGRVPRPRDRDARQLGCFVGEPLVHGAADRRPGRRGEPVDLGEGGRLPRDHLHRVVVERVQQPARESPVVGQPDEVFHERGALHRAPPPVPGDDIAREPGRPRQVVDQHGRDSTPAEAPHHRERSEVAAQDQGAGLSIHDLHR